MGILTYEKQAHAEEGRQDEELSDVQADNVEEHHSVLQSWWRKLLASQTVEEGGVRPVPVEDRNNTRIVNIFTFWFTVSLNLIPLVTGMLGTLSYGLSLRDCSLVIIFLSLLCCIPPAYLATLGPKTGMRQMVQARFSFGYYLATIPVLLNLATLTGFVVIEGVIGGLTLSSVTQKGISSTVGIVIMDILGLFLSFCGFKILHKYERFAWIPTLIALVVAVGCGGKHLSNQAPTEPPTAQTVLSFAALVAGALIPWSTMSSDFSTYMPPQTSSVKVFLYSYCGLLLPNIPLFILGSAIGGAVPNVPLWQERYTATSVGGVLAAMLEPAGGFGRFMVVILSMSLLGNNAATMYSISLNFQLLVPWLVRVPRAFFSIVITAIAIPVSIKAAASFFENLENFIAVIGYWAAAFVTVVILEHTWFRRSDASTYDITAWDQPKSLPSGIAAVTAAFLSVALIVPCMAQVWYTGPIAVHTGDIGFEMAFLVTAACYIPFRYLEIKISKRL